MGTGLTETGAVHAPDHLLEEGVARGADAEGVNRLEYLSSVTAVASRVVVSGDPEKQPGVEICEPRESAPVPWPVYDTAAGHVARSDDHVEFPGGVQDRGQV